MKHSNLKIFGILACLFAVGSCFKEVEQPDMYGQVGDTAFFKAVNADNDQTRTVRREDGSLWWSPSETIRLFYGNQSFKFTSTNTEAAASVTFKGSLSGLSYNNADKFWALYPYAEADSFDGSFLTMTLPSEQKAVAGSFDKNVFPCVATSRDFNLSFRNVCGGVKFCVSKAGVSKVVFKGNLSEPLAGTVKVGLKGESNIPFVSECLEPQTEITLSASNGQTLEVGTWYHLVALPTRLTKGYSMVLYFIDGHSELVSSNNTVEIKRSFFGKLTNVDEKVLGGGDQSAIYVGIIGFNDDLTRFPITLLNRTTKPSFDAFIDGLSMRNGTLLYYSVNQSLNTLQGAIVPEELGNASLITFTDGLDQGTPGLVDPYPGDEAYLRNIQSRIQNDRISGQRVSAWSIGLKGRDAVIIDDGLFEYNLQSIASSPNMAFTEGDISTVNSRFQEIATHFRETIFRQTVTVELPTLDNCRVRFILDGATSMSDSKKYIEGDFIQSTRSLTNVKYYGLTSSSGSNVAGVKKGIFTVFTFQELANKDGVLILQEDINEWYNRWGSWAQNSEFVPEEQCSVSMHKKAALVLLNLDCSTSLDANLKVNPPLPAVFPDLQKSAKSFIEALCKYTITASSVSVNKKSMIMTPGNRSTISAEVLPEDAVNRDVRWSSSDLSVAKVSVYGEVTALKEGTAIITATTLDGGLTAHCVVTVIGDSGMNAVDLGLSVKWASCNLGASSLEGTGNYYSWGELAPKTDYNWSTYKFLTSGTTNESAHFYKYVLDSSRGVVDNRTMLEPADDAARQKLGANWRYPTEDEFIELMDNCSIIRTSINDVYGMKLTSKKPGFTDKWIFLPAAGIMSGNVQRYVGEEGRYLSASVYRNNSAATRIMKFDSSLLSFWNLYRWAGASIRPVLQDPKRVSWVTLSNVSLTLVPGGSSTLTATISPVSAENKSVTWTSSDTSVATVSSSGIVTAQSVGSATITVTSQDGNKTATCDVTVRSKDVDSSGHEGVGEDNLF